MVERVEISQVLSQIRSLQAQMPRPAEDIAPSREISAENFVRPVSENNFGTLFNSAVDAVNGVQQESSALKKAYELGTPGVSLTQVMVASEKAGVAFQAMTQVRNKLVEAYKDIMNMPV